MTRKQAIKIARKRWGDDATLRLGPSRSSPELRAAATKEIKARKAEIAKIDAEIAERLEGLDWYQELLRRKADLRAPLNRLTGEALYYKFGVVFDFTWRGYGDTWEEALAMARTNEPASLRY